MNQGAPADIEDISQAPNGDIWIGSTRGLFSFDGIKFTRFNAKGDVQLRNDMLYSMFTAKNGDIWVGYYSGGASLIHNGHVRNYSDGLPLGPLKQFLEDHEGRVWTVSIKGVSYFKAGRWRSIRWDAGNGRPYRMLVARNGTLWIATSRALLFVPAGQDAVHRTNVDVNEAWALGEGPDGRIWLSDLEHGTRPVDPQPGEPRAWDKAASLDHEFVARRIIFDAKGHLWASLQTQPGLVLVAHPEAVRTGAALSGRDITQWYRESNGLTSDFAGSLLEDRHGVIWGGTSFGLDKFLPVNFSLRSEFAEVPIHGFRAALSPNGTLAIADEKLVHIQSAPGSHEIVEMRGAPVGLCANGSGTVLVANDEGLFSIKDKRSTRVALPDEFRSRFMLSCEFDRGGRLWLLTRDDGLYRSQGATWKHVLPQDAIGIAWPRMMMIDSQDRLWLGGDGSGVKLLSRGRLSRFDAADGLEIGQVHTAVSIDGGALFGGESGLAFYDGKRFHSVPQTSHPYLSVITGLAVDGRGDLWVSGTRGVSVLQHGALQQIRDGKPLRLRHHFGNIAEIPGFSQLNCCANTLFKAPSGELWILTNAGIVSVDPAHLQLKSSILKAQVRSVVSGMQTYATTGQITLHAGGPNLRIDFTSDSLADADQIEFRYRLQGVDDDWVDAGTRRETFYTSLPNGDYRFDVQARRSGEEWSASGSGIDITVPPTFSQTLLAKILAVAVIVALLWLIYALRLRMVAGQIRMRMSERMEERERIARELHDTLLQGFQGLILRFHNAAAQLPESEAARAQIDNALDRAEEVLIAGRDRVRDLRADSKDLSHVLIETAADMSRNWSADFNLKVEGSPRQIHPTAAVEICRLADEAIRNAFQHAQASSIDARLIYRSREFRFEVRDDGVGLPPEVAASGRREGHYGLVGMRERAARIGGKVTIGANSNGGTVVVLTVPEAAAYVAGKGGRRWWHWEGRILDT